MVTHPVRQLTTDLRRGRITRRRFIAATTALGLAPAMSAMLANNAMAQSATPAASPSAAMRPDAGTEGQERGAGGDLKLFQWQAPTSLSPHVVTGSKDFLGAMLVLEPLIHYSPESEMIPNLITELPTVANGTLADDLSWVQFSLLPNVTWSDGEPFTAEDIAFTIGWVQDPANNSVNQGVFAPITQMEVIDPLTVRVSFDGPNPFWFDPFTGTATGFVYPKHILDGGGEEANNAFMSAPIGTGPYKVDAFSPNDQATYSINDRYREPNKPFFSSVLIKGGGDAVAAARSVLQTGDFDFAWKLQVDPDTLGSMTGDDAKGVIMPYPGVAVERVNFNFSDPNTEVGGQKSEMNTPNPRLSDDAVREAIAMAIDRQTIADTLYGNGQEAAANLLYGDDAVESPNTSWSFDPDGANAKLDDAGWTRDGEVRAKDGVQLKLSYATSVNPVRQKTQAVVKANLQKIGVSVDIQQIDSSIYFDTAVGNDQNINHFYWDLDMLQSVPNSPRPMQSMETWYAGPDKRGIAQKSNNWAGQNTSRWANADYDAAFEAARVETDPDKLAELFVRMNDLIINNDVVIPLVVAGEPRAASKRLRGENIALAPFSGDYWNIANWNLAEGQ